MNIKEDKKRAARVKRWIRKGRKANVGGEEWSEKERGVWLDCEDVMMGREGVGGVQQRWGRGFMWEGCVNDQSWKEERATLLGIFKKRLKTPKATYAIQALTAKKEAVNSVTDEHKAELPKYLRCTQKKAPSEETTETAAAKSSRRSYEWR